MPDNLFLLYSHTFFIFIALQLKHLICIYSRSAHMMMMMTIVIFSHLGWIEKKFLVWIWVNCIFRRISEVSKILKLTSIALKITSRHPRNAQNATQSEKDLFLQITDCKTFNLIMIVSNVCLHRFFAFSWRVQLWNYFLCELEFFAS